MQIDYICRACGHAYCNVSRVPEYHIATFHEGTCDICGTESVPVTQPRDFGHIRREVLKDLKRSVAQR